MARRPVAADLNPQDDFDPQDDALDLAGSDQQQDDQQDDQQQDDVQYADDAQQDDDQQQVEQREPPPRRQRQRNDDRESAAEQRAADAERRATEAVARAEAIAAQFAQIQNRESPEQEAARLATMTPEQQVEYRVNKALGNHERTVRDAQLNMALAADKASFDMLVATNKQVARIAPEVERKHAELVAGARQNPNMMVPGREQVLKYMLGERALKMMREGASESDARRQRVNQQRVRPGSPRSDVSANRRREQTLEQRLENVAL